MLKVGLTATKEEVVTEEITAKAIGSGDLLVYGTPAMITLMESTSAKLIAKYLSEEESSVGTKVSVNHIRATPVGVKVVCTSEIIEIDRKRIVFKVSVSDNKGLVGEGEHERFIINIEKFLERIK